MITSGFKFLRIWSILPVELLLEKEFSFSLYKILLIENKYLAVCGNSNEILLQYLTNNIELKPFRKFITAGLENSSLIANEK